MKCVGKKSLTMPKQKTVRYRKAERVLPYVTERGEKGGGRKKHGRDNSVRILFLKYTPAIHAYRTQVLTQKAEHSVSTRHN